MKKTSFIKQIDSLFTKITKVIVGDIPLDIDTKGNTHKIDTTTSNENPNNNTFIKSTYYTVKTKLLAIGTPAEEKVLYSKVVSRETIQELTTQVTNVVKKPSNETTINSHTTTNTATVQPVVKKVEVKIVTPIVKKTTVKKIVQKKAPTPTKIAAIKKPVAKKVVVKKIAPVKKPISKKTTAKKAPAKTDAVNKIIAKIIAKKDEEKKTVTIKKPVAKKATVKKTAVKKVEVKKTAPVKKTIAKARPVKKVGTKKAAKIRLYIKDIKQHYGEVDEDFLAIIVKNLGPSIYRKNAELVSCANPKELKTVKNNFLIKKLGIDASQGVLNAAIQDVCEELKKTNIKYRATFYYRLAKKFKKESVLR